MNSAFGVDHGDEVSKAAKPFPPSVSGKIHQAANNGKGALKRLDKAPVVAGAATGAVAAGVGYNAGKNRKKKFGKALASPMPKMAKLTKPKAPGMGGGKPGGSNPMLRQVNRLTQGASAPMTGSPNNVTGGLQQRLAQRRGNVRANASRNNMGGLQRRLGGNR